MIQSFNQIRLTNNIVNASGSRLTVNGSGVLYQSETGQFASINSLNNTGAYLTSLINAASAGVSSLNGSSGILNIVGTGNVSITTVGQTITISGNTGAYANFVTLGQTGVFASVSNLLATGAGLQTSVNALNIWTGSSTGLYYPLSSNPSNYVTTAQTGAFASNVALIASGALFTSYTGKIQIFTSGISPTGLDTYTIYYPQVFASVPKVLCTVEVTGNYAYGVSIANRTTSGFNALFSDYIGESGVLLDVYSSIN